MKMMKLCYEIAKESFERNSKEIPIGCIITDENQNILSSATNKVESFKNSICHAEMIAIEMASKKINSKFLFNCNLYVTIEPCPMCAFAISLSKIKNVFIGIENKKTGALLNNIKIFQSDLFCYRPNIYFGFLESEIKSLMQDFFKKLRM